MSAESAPSGGEGGARVASAHGVPHPLALAVLFATLAAGCGGGGGEASRASPAPGVALQSLSVTDLTPQLRRSAVLPEVETLGSELREAAFFLGTGVARARVLVPKDEPVLRFAYGARAQPGAASSCRASWTLVVTARPLGSPALATRPLLSLEGPSVDVWQAASASLAELSGQTVDLEFTARRQPSPCGQYLAVGEVRVVGGRSEDPPPPDVWLLVVDTLRADRVGFLGSTTTQTPAMDALAARGTVFSRALSTSGWTVESILSIFTGAWPVTTGPEFGSGVTFHARLPTLAERFSAAGYRTVGVSGNPNLTERNGAVRGFDVWHQGDGLQNTVQRLEEILAEGGPRRPRFVYVHLMAPHIPYVSTRELREARMRARGIPEPWPELWSKSPHAPDQVADPSEYPTVMALYEAAVEHADSHVQGALDVLQRSGRAGRTWVTFLADHGEEFWEHGAFEHGHSLHEELLHVPLVLAPPLGTQPRVARVDAPVSLIDVGPTLLDIADLPGLRSPNGRSLLPWTQDGPPADAAMRLFLPGGNLYGGLRRAIVEPERRRVVTEPDYTVSQPLPRELWQARFDAAGRESEAQTRSEERELARFDRDRALLERLAVSGESRLALRLRPSADGTASIRIEPGREVVLESSSPDTALVELAMDGEAAEISVTAASGPLLVRLGISGLREDVPHLRLTLRTGEGAADAERIVLPDGRRAAGAGAVSVPTPWLGLGRMLPPDMAPDADVELAWELPATYLQPTSGEDESRRLEALRALGYLGG
jgi:arylsulfatase A-like enzyme